MVNKCYIQPEFILEGVDEAVHRGKWLSFR